MPNSDTKWTVYTAIVAARLHSTPESVFRDLKESLEENEVTWVEVIRVTPGDGKQR
jgi:hypothetical protein